MPQRDANCLLKRGLLTGCAITCALLFWLTARVDPVWAASVQATVNRNTVALGESIELSVTIEDGDGSVDVSSIDNFNVVSNGSSSNFEFTNGRSSRKMIYSYLLLPEMVGQQTIPALPVDVGGQVTYTEPIIIQVNDPGAARANSQDLFFKATLSSDRPYVGEQIICTFTLYSAVQMTEAKFVKPDFQGFIVNEVEEQRTQRTVVNGRQYIQRDLVYILTPQETGPMTITPAELHCNVLASGARGRRRSPFDDFFGRMQVEPRLLKSDPLQLTVKALPRVPQKSSFSGLIGQFELSAGIEKTALTVGDSVNLTLTLSGRGNIVDAPVIRMTIPEAFKQYADAPREEVNVTASGYSGKKIFRSALVPVKIGEYILPGLNLVYFNLERDRYETLTTDPITLTVEPSATDPSQMPATASLHPTRPKNEVTFTGRDILALKEDLDALSTHRAISLIGFLFWLMLPVICFGSIKLVTKYLGQAESRQKQMARQTRRILRTAAKTDPGQADFLSLLYRALVSAVRTFSVSEGESLTWAEAEMLLQQGGCGKETSQSVAQLLKKIETTNYSGSGVNIAARRELLVETQSAARRLLK